MPWYSFTPTLSPSNPHDPNEYTLLGSAPSCPGVNNFICAIQANDNMGKPDITVELCIELLIALQNRIDRTNVKLKP